jgi:hypothetical protein
VNFRCRTRSFLTFMNVGEAMGKAMAEMLEE